MQSVLVQRSKRAVRSTFVPPHRSAWLRCTTRWMMLLFHMVGADSFSCVPALSAPRLRSHLLVVEQSLLARQLARPRAGRAMVEPAARSRLS